MKDKTTSPNAPIPVAVIGMGCMFAGAEDLKGYWRLLLNAEDAIDEVPPTHWSGADYYDPDPKKPDHVYCTRGGFLAPVHFDPTEFGIPPSILEATDTAQLLGLLTAKYALEDAGYASGTDFDRTRTSVILGVTGTQELVIPLAARLSHPLWRKALAEAGVSADQAREVISRIGDGYVSWQENSFPGLLGNVVAGRISNRLDLGGTNCVVDAACASSFSAINLAIMELETRRSDMVLSGGVDALNDIFMHMCFSKTQVLSRSGDARPFSADADGTVLGEGIGIVALKRLDDALAAGDRIYAVIRAMGAASDGKSQSIYAPRAEGQIAALTRAYQAAGIPPATVRLFEAHGTGTRVGDAVEFSALSRFLNQSGAAPQSCAVGSVKSMIGHTKAAAGAAGLIKAALALHHKIIPPTLKVENPDPDLDMENSPLYLSTRSRPWIADPEHPRRSGVSAFGFGGSNFHMVLEEHLTERPAVAWDGTVEIAAWSAQTPDELAQALDRFMENAGDAPGCSDMARQAAESRQSFSPQAPCRLVAVLDKGADPLITLKTARKNLSEKGTEAPWSVDGVHYGIGAPSGGLAFLFPGQGSQYVDMARELACRFPEMLSTLEAADIAVDDATRLSDRIYPRFVGDRKHQKSLEAQLRRTDMAQPAIGAVSAGMTEILARFGITPDAVAGHSYGELSALLAAGTLSREDFFSLSAARGACMARAGEAGDAGTMLAVKAHLADIEERLLPRLSDVVLANRNSPDQGVLSGATEAIESAHTLCKEMGFKAVRLPVAAAFHSTLVESARDPFARHLESAAFAPGRIPVFANTTAEPYPSSADEARTLLAGQMTRPVDFVGTVENLYGNGFRTFVEVGPRQVLTGLVRATLGDRPAATVALDASGGRGSGTVDLARVLAMLAAEGRPVDLAAWEIPPAPQRKAVMSIPLTGANYRAPRPQRAEAPKPVPAVTPAPRAETPSPAVSPAQPIHPRPAAAEKAAPVSFVPDPPQAPPRSAAPGAGALSAVQEGLRSIQDLQVRTARAHEKFLETQAQAGQTFQRMMESIERMVAGTPAPSARYRSPAPAARTESIPAAAPVPPVPAPAPTPVETPAPAVQSAAPTTPEAPGPNPVLPALLSTVSQLTGYPEEMLAADMDMEADLGIDSIKRVEILSALEEALPGLPAVSPEIMGELKTLGQIADYLNDLTGSAETPANSEPGKTVPTSQTMAGSAVQAALVAVVSELTGYPEEMLTDDMDMEADLGIDSIKRVEILSALEDRLPGLPAVSPEEMAELKTLGQITTYLAGAAPPATVSAVEPVAIPQEEKAPATAVMPHLIAVISELTGYPEEMLTDDMDMEADLGIDSIKRVEILSALEERLPELPPVSPEQMAQLKTLGQIAQCLGPSPTAGQPASPATRQPPAPEPAVDAPDSPPPLSRREVIAVETPRPPAHAVHSALDATVIVYGAASPLADALCRTLKAQGLAAQRVLPEFDRNGTYAPAGLILLGQGGSPETLPAEAFALAQLAGPALQARADAGKPAFLATVTRLDGAFGFCNETPAEPWTGALAGLAKTAALEWQAVRCLALDVAPAWTDADDAAQAVLSELFAQGEPNAMEIGLTEERRYTLRCVEAEAGNGVSLPGAGETVLVSGGARGVTAASALALAKASPATLVLMGRSPAPEPEPEWLAGCTDPAEIKRALMEHGRAGDKPDPRKLASAYKAVAAGREIHRTLDALKAAGAGGHYVSVDVRDAEAVRRCVDGVRREYGPIRALIHGAGVLHDRRIVDKTAEQFADVYETKVRGLEHLLAATAEDDLSHIVVFSSVAARFGNAGQADYAMANEALNKIARREAFRRPDCRVAAINWGPWDGGMVTPSLGREFARRGVDLIPLEAGADAMVREMAAAGPVEVVFGAGLGRESAADGNESADLSPALSHQVDLTRYPVLDHHRLQGRPVVPLALITEWMAHGALHSNPGLRLAGMENLRLLNGIKMGDDSLTVHFMAGPTARNNGHFHVPVEIRGTSGDRPRVHAQATALLEDAPGTETPRNADLGDVGQGPYSKSVQEAYEKVLFHGPALHGIEEILGCCDKGIRARIRTAPAPSEWIVDPLRSRWIADPLVLDSAFQLAILWSDEMRKIRCLPSFVGSYRQYGRTFPAGSVQVTFRVGRVSRHKLTGEFIVTDETGRVAAHIADFEAAMDPSLAAAFQRSCMPSCAA